MLWALWTPPLTPLFVDPKMVQNHLFWWMALTSLTKTSVLYHFVNLDQFGIVWSCLSSPCSHILRFYLHYYCIPENGDYKIRNKYLKHLKTSLNYPVVGFVDPLFVDPKMVQNQNCWFYSAFKCLLQRHVSCQFGIIWYSLVLFKQPL